MKFKIELELNDVRTALNEWFANQGIEATFNVTGNNNQFSIHVTNATPIANKPKVIEAVEPKEPVEVNLVKTEEPKPKVIVEEESGEETKEEEEETITGNIPSKSVVADLFK